MKKEKVADKPNITPNSTFARMFLHQIPLYGLEDGLDCLRLAGTVRGHVPYGIAVVCAVCLADCR